jgi:protein O-GlcNAc transferase
MAAVRSLSAPETDDATNGAMNKHLAEAEQLFLARRFGEAAALCRKAMRKPQDVVRARRLLADCYYNQGVVDLFGSGLVGDAEAHFRLAVEQYPQHCEARQNLAALFAQQNRNAEAIAAYRDLLKLAPERLLAWRDLAVACQKMDDLAGAEQALAELAARMPDDGSALLRDALLLHSVVPDAAYPAQVRRRIDEKLAAFVASGRPLRDPLWFPGTYFYLSYHGLCNRDLHTRIATAHLAAAPSLAWQAPAVAEWRGAGTRIRIGLASTAFFNHSIGHTSRGFFEQLDRACFEVVAIRLGNAPYDEIAVAIDAAADQVVRVPLDDLQTAREHIGALALDILFWQDIGMDPYSYLLAFARLAPVQLTSFGHPDTTGIPNVDYFLSSQLYESADAAAHYSETLVCVPAAGTLSCYHRPALPVAAPERARFGIAADAHIYLCPQTLFKLHPDMDEIFLALLAGDPQAQVVLIAPAAGRMRELVAERFARRSPLLVARVCFVERLAHADYLQLIRCANAVLDTLHFNGQNTSLEAFAMGVPVVTLAGGLQRARHTAGMYRAMGWTELVAVDADDYVARALALANDPEFAARCRARIGELASVLYDDHNFIRNCEEIFADLVGRAAAQRA